MVHLISDVDAFLTVCLKTFLDQASSFLLKTIKKQLPKTVGHFCFWGKKITSAGLNVAFVGDFHCGRVDFGSFPVAGWLTCDVKTNRSGQQWSSIAQRNGIFLAIVTQTRHYLLLIENIPDLVCDISVYMTCKLLFVVACWHFICSLHGSL